MRPSSGGSPIRCRRWRLLWPCLRAGPCDVGCAPVSALTAAAALPAVAPPADSGRFRRKWAPISPWALDFWVVSGGSCSLSASPTWGNADAGWRFGLIRPAKPPRSCEQGSRALKVAHEDVQLRRGRNDAERIGAFAECGDRNTSIG